MQFKNKPFKHQEDYFYKHRESEYVYINADPGLGKTCMGINDVAWNYGQGRINGLLVIAPNGVDSQWINSEIPKHLPDYIEYDAVYWDSKKINTKAFQKEAFKLFQQDHRLKIFAINFEAVAASEKAFKFVLDFIKTNRCMVIIDESQRIKSEKAKITQKVTGLNKKVKECIKEFAVMRRTFSGTPLSRCVQDLFPQYYFLDEHIINLSSAFIFKHRYCIIKKQRRAGAQVAKERALYESGRTKRPPRTEFEYVDGYQNLDDLKSRILPHTFIVRKKDVKDLPPKIFRQIDVKMSDNQARIYKDMEKEMSAMLEDVSIETYLDRLISGEHERSDDVKVDADNALEKMIRLRQIVGGIIKDDAGKYHSIDKVPAKLKAMMNDLEDNDDDQKVIIWANFTEEINLIAKELRKKYGKDSASIYNGETPSAMRECIRKRFQCETLSEDEKEYLTEYGIDYNVELKFFIGNPAAAGTGLNLGKGTRVYRYDRSFNAINEWQAEDRSHRLDSTESIVYTDLVCKGTIDELIKENLNKKFYLKGDIYG